MKKSFLLACVLLLALGLLIDNSLFSTKVKRVRDLASVDNETNENSMEGNSVSGNYQLDLSMASPEEFAKAFKYSLISPATITKNKAEVELRLGNFLVADPLAPGRKVFICNRYPNLKLTFAAEGIATAGETPLMSLTTDCRPDPSDSNFLESVTVPFHTIIQSPASREDFSFPGKMIGSTVDIRFIHVVGEWPRQWTLVGAELFSSANDRKLSVNGYEVISIIGQPLTLEW